MHGPYDLTAGNIDRFVRAYVPGVFALGYTRENGGFVVRYIGRADTDVGRELKAQPADETARFKWVEVSSQKAGFDTQCRLYHDFGGGDALENEDHPAPPAGTKWSCVVCGVSFR
jgi:hypothetical protein